MFLSTRDSSVEFFLDICNRVAFVDFTMTRSGAYNIDFDVVPNIGGDYALETPDGTKLEHFLSCNELLGKSRKMRTLADDDKFQSAAGPSKPDLTTACMDAQPSRAVPCMTHPAAFDTEYSVHAIQCQYPPISIVLPGDHDRTQTSRPDKPPANLDELPDKRNCSMAPKYISVSEWIPDPACRLSQLDGITSVQRSLQWLVGRSFPKHTPQQLIKLRRIGNGGVFRRFRRPFAFSRYRPHRRLSCVLISAALTKEPVHGIDAGAQIRPRNTRRVCRHTRKDALFWGYEDVLLWGYEDSESRERAYIEDWINNHQAEIKKQTSKGSFLSTRTFNFS
ncbi:hypothetical protein EDB19DRAFT_1913677 [Suillus lakei]|nr:hypothetical protein EDB19DRAFT_1913677 [Suillus lakei]